VGILEGLFYLPVMDAVAQVLVSIPRVPIKLHLD